MLIINPSELKFNVHGEAVIETPTGSLLLQRYPDGSLNPEADDNPGEYEIAGFEKSPAGIWYPGHVVVVDPETLDWQADGNAEYAFAHSTTFMRWASPRPGMGFEQYTGGLIAAITRTSNLRIEIKGWRQGYSGNGQANNFWFQGKR